MKRSDVTRAVADLTRELGRPPLPGIIAARLGQPETTMEAALKALVSENALEVDPSGGYRISQNVRQTVMIGQSQEQAQQELSFGDDGKEPTVGVEVSDGANAAFVRVDVKSTASDQTTAEKIKKMLNPVRVEPGLDLEYERENAPKRFGEYSTALVGRWQITVIRAVMAASGLGASVVSGYFAISRLAEFMPRVLAGVLGTFLVAFAVIAFETVLVFVQRRGYFVAGMFMMLWAIVAVFTLTCTVAGFYSFYASVRIERAKAGAGEEAKRIELDSVRSNIEQLTQRLEDQRRQLGPLQAIVEDASSSVERRSEYGRVFYDAQTRILGVQREMDRLQASLDVERQKEAGILAEAPAAAVANARPRQDFYEFLSGIIGARPSTIELVSAIFPSIFIDLISSIGLAVALFLQAPVGRKEST